MQCIEMPGCDLKVGAVVEGSPVPQSAVVAGKEDAICRRGGQPLSA
jgi:hypothetical protein